jgi:hypothetical protein
MELTRASTRLRDLILSFGTFNTALGFSALKADTNGDINTAVGGQALLSNTGGSYNTAVGENALVKADGQSERHSSKSRPHKFKR